MSKSLAKRFGDGHPVLEEIELVFAELLAHAIEASPSDSEVRYSYSYDGVAIELKVMDSSTHFRL